MCVVFPARVLDIMNPGGTQLSDIFSISSLTVTLSSDGNTSGEAALPPIVIALTAVSDENTPAGISDTLTWQSHINTGLSNTRLVDKKGYLTCADDSGSSNCSSYQIFRRIPRHGSVSSPRVDFTMLTVSV